MGHHKSFCFFDAVKFHLCIGKFAVHQVTFQLMTVFQCKNTVIFVQHFGQLCHVDAPFFRRKPDGFVILYHTVSRIATFVLSFSPEKAQKIPEDPLHCRLYCDKIVCTVNRVPCGTEYMWRFPL